ncbi:MAG: transporter substrate-binding domain-containing protein, partial [Ectothiorhodospiraceae bacterium]
MDRYVDRWRNGTLGIAMVLTLLVAAAHTPNVQAASRLDQILEAGVLKVGTTGDYKPFTYQGDGSDEFEGLDIDLARSLADSLGVKVEFVKTSWPNLMKDFESDKFDIGMGGITVTLSRQQVAYFSIPEMTDGKTPITQCEDKGKYQ